MTEICAAIGLVQLKKLDEFNEKRIRNASIYNNRISGLPWLTKPTIKNEVKHVFHQYVVKVNNTSPINRPLLIEYLNKMGIGVAVHYPMPIYKQPIYQNLGFTNIKCPNTERVCNQVLSLPVHPMVKREDIEYISDILMHIE